MTIDYEPYKEIAAAVIKLAITDYEAVFKHMLRHPESELAKKNAEHEKKFFYSDWFVMLSENLDGPRLVRMIEEKVRKEVMPT